MFYNEKKEIVKKESFNKLPSFPFLSEIAEIGFKDLSKLSTFHVGDILTKLGKWDTFPAKIPERSLIKLR